MKRCLAYVGAVAFAAACGSNSGDDDPGSSAGSTGAAAHAGGGGKTGTTGSGASGGTGGSTGGAETGGTTNGSAGDTSESGAGPDDGGRPGSGGASTTGGASSGATGGSTATTGGSGQSAGAGNEGGASDFCFVGEDPGPVTSFDSAEASGTTPDGAAWELGHSMTSDDVTVGVEGPGRGDDGYAAYLQTAATEQQAGSLRLQFATTNGRYDAAAFAGFSFYAKGDLSGGTAQVVVHTFVDSYTTYFDVPADWEKRTVSFADFTTGEEYEPWDPTRITEIEFAVSGGPIDFWVDDVAWR